MSLSNEEIIARLRAAGVQAVVCLVCNQVKEVRDDHITPHRLPDGALCLGSNVDLLGDVDEEFRSLTGVLHMDEPRRLDDYARIATEEARLRLSTLLDAVEAKAKAHPRVHAQVEGTNGEPFCGCVPCIVREVAAVIWPFAAQAEVNDIITYLTTEASREGMTKPQRKAARRIASDIAEQKYDRESEDL